MLRAKFGDVAVDRGDEIFAAASVGASVGGTVPGSADFFEETGLQETFMADAERTARHGNHAASLTLVDAGFMFLTERKSAAIR